MLLLALHRLGRGFGWPWVMLAGASFALCVQSSGYYAVAAALLVAAFVIARHRTLRARLIAIRIAAALALGALLSLPYVLTFLGLRQDQGLRRPPGLSEQMAFRPAADVTSHTYLYR